MLPRTSKNSGYLRKNRGRFRRKDVIYVLLVASASVLGSLLMTVIQIGLVHSALRTATIVPLVVSVPIATWMAHQNARIADLNAQLSELVRRDSLTGLLNRRAFLSEFEMSASSGGALIICDVDGFKQINDLSGHACGDKALIAISDLMKLATGPRDILGRLGGDEFGIFLPGADRPKGLEIADNLRRMVEGASHSSENTPRFSTLSLGVHWLAPRVRHCEASLSEAMAEADMALYAAKARGRNQVAATASPAAGV